VFFAVNFPGNYYTSSRERSYETRVRCETGSSHSLDGRELQDNLKVTGKQLGLLVISGTVQRSNTKDTSTNPPAFRGRIFRDFRLFRGELIAD
jgi:hypothetical protein